MLCTPIFSSGFLTNSSNCDNLFSKKYIPINPPKKTLAIKIDKLEVYLYAINPII